MHPLNRPRYQTDKSGYNTTCATLERLPAPGRAPPIPDTTATPGRCTGQRRPPIIIRYIRAQGVPAIDPCQTVQHTADHASPAGQLLSCADRLQVLHPAHLLRDQPGGVSALPGIKTGPGRNRLDLAHVRRCAFSLARRAARNYWRLSPHLFSGFRPIANRGQQ